MATRNKRSRSRVDTAMDVVLCQGGINKIPLRTRNLSLKGMLCDQTPAIGEAEKGTCKLTFTLGRDVCFHIDALIVRNDTNGLALDFTGMDEAAFFHLRNLVRFQSGDPDAIDKELSVPAFTCPGEAPDA